MLAVGYYDAGAVDITDGTTLERVGGQSPANVTHSTEGLGSVAWSRDGRTLFAAGGVDNAQGRTGFSPWTGVAWAANVA